MTFLMYIRYSFHDYTIQTYGRLWDSKAWRASCQKKYGMVDGIIAILGFLFRNRQSEFRRLTTSTAERPAGLSFHTFRTSYCDTSRSPTSTMATQFSTIIGRYAVKAGRSTVPRARPNLSSTFPAAIATHFLMNSARLVPSRNFASDDGSHSDFAPQRKQVKNDIDEAVEMIKEHVKEHPVMLYMKGSPNMPMCGFSSRVVQVLKGTGVDFSSVNVLDYPSIREGVKKFSEWPTIPQLYVNGEFIGGSCSCN